MDQVHLNTIGKFYLVDLTEMTDKEMLDVFFEFLKHMEKLTDVIEWMAVKMEEMDRRIQNLESNIDEDAWDDEEWGLRPA